MHNYSEVRVPVFSMGAIPNVVMWALLPMDVKEPLCLCYFSIRELLHSCVDYVSSIYLKRGL